MPTAPDRRHRPLALAGALLVLASMTLLPRVAEAQACGGIFPPCPPTDSSTTSTTEEESTTSTTEREDTSTTERRSTTTEDVSTTVSTVTVSTVNDLLVPGDGTEGSESTTSVAPISSSDSGLSDDQLILLIVGGLGVVAVVSALLTWRYWGATRPVIIDPPSRPPASR